MSGLKELCTIGISSASPKLCLKNRNYPSLRSWRDLARESFCFGSEAVNESGEAVRGLVKNPVEFPSAQIRGFFFNYAFTSAREFRIG